MEAHFNTQKYISSLGEELIYAFAKSAMTTHPHSVGSSRENIVKLKLKSILPGGVGVGSGFVVDSFGRTSNQCDIILYEEDFVQKFVVNEDLYNTYYNCESVIAVGEVKSDASIQDIESSFKKFKRIRELKRYISQLDEEENAFRSYLSKLSAVGIDSEKYNQFKKPHDQIYTFILCKSLSTPLTSIVQKANEIFEDRSQYFNTILSIEDFYIRFGIRNGNNISTKMSAIESNCIYSVKNNDYSFNLFVNDLITFIINGRTVPLNYSRYNLLETKCLYVIDSVDL